MARRAQYIAKLSADLSAVQIQHAQAVAATNNALVASTQQTIQDLVTKFKAALAMDAQQFLQFEQATKIPNQTTAASIDQVVKLLQEAIEKSTQVLTADSDKERARTEIRSVLRDALRKVEFERKCDIVDLFERGQCRSRVRRLLELAADLAEADGDRIGLASVGGVARQRLIDQLSDFVVREPALRNVLNRVSGGRIYGPSRVQGGTVDPLTGRILTAGTWRRSSSGCPPFPVPKRGADSLYYDAAANRTVPVYVTRPDGTRYTRCVEPGSEQEYASRHSRSLRRSLSPRVRSPARSPSRTPLRTPLRQHYARSPRRSRSRSPSPRRRYLSGSEGCPLAKRGMCQLAGCGCGARTAGTVGTARSAGAIASMPNLI
jgi:hypothetical protein